MPVTDIFCEQGTRPLQELQRDKGGLFLVYQTQLDIALKVALRYSRVEELEVVSLRVICDWLSRFKQKTKTDGSERDNIEKRGRIGRRRRQRQNGRFGSRRARMAHHPQDYGSRGFVGLDK